MVSRMWQMFMEDVETDPAAAVGWHAILVHNTQCF